MTSIHRIILSLNVSIVITDNKQSVVGVKLRQGFNVERGLDGRVVTEVKKTAKLSASVRNRTECLDTSDVKEMITTRSVSK